MINIKDIVDSAIEANTKSYIKNYKQRLIWLRRTDEIGKQNETKYFYICRTISKTLQNLFPEYDEYIYDKFLEIELDLDKIEYYKK